MAAEAATQLTRYLARFEPVPDEVQPLLSGSNLRDDNSALTVDLTNPDVIQGDRITLHLLRPISSANFKTELTTI